MHRRDMTPSGRDADLTECAADVHANMDCRPQVR